MGLKSTGSPTPLQVIFHRNTRLCSEKGISVLSTRPCCQAQNTTSLDVDGCWQFEFFYKTYRNILLVVVGVEVEAVPDGIEDRPEEIQHVRLFSTTSKVAHKSNKNPTIHIYKQVTGRGVLRGVHKTNGSFTGIQLRGDREGSKGALEGVRQRTKTVNDFVERQAGVLKDPVLM